MSQATEEIKLKIDIVDLISEYILVKRAGSSLKALCPFHQEKTPSFMISPQRQTWHCFGCNTGGDIFEFIMKMEGLDFPEALKLLADKAGVKLPNFSSEISSSQRNRLLEILKLSAKFYNKILLESPRGEPARTYLKKRQVVNDMIEEFEIGFIPEEWDILTSFLLKKGFGINDLIAAGLTIKKDGGGFYDRFRGRIIFPINDVHGNIVGFTGRLLNEAKPEAGGKYVNTPQTIVYDKSRVIYALDKAKQEAKRQDYIVLAEGQMDVIACHQAGQINAVASSGTALTREQIKLLKRFTDNLFIAFDADLAGQNAALRGLEIALAEGMKIKIITLPKEVGKDPDECLKKNPEIWFQAVKGAQNIMEYLFSQTLAGRDLKNPGERGAVSTILLGKINLLPDVVEQDYWIKRLAMIMDIDYHLLYEKLQTIKKQISPVAQKTTEDKKNEKRPEEIASEKLLSLIIYRPAFFYLALETLKPESVEPASLKNLYNNLLVFHNTQNPSLDKTEEVIHSFKAWNGSKELCQIVDLLGLLYDKEFANLLDKEAEEEIKNLVNSLNTWYNKNIRKDLEKTLRQAESAGDKEKIKEVMQKFKDIL